MSDSRPPLLLRSDHGLHLSFGENSSCHGIRICGELLEVGIPGHVPGMQPDETAARTGPDRHA